MKTLTQLPTLRSLRINRQSGAALFTALIFLVIITMLGLTAMRSSTLELRMAGNEEARSDNFQRTQSIIDAAISDPNNIPVVGTTDSYFCTAGVTNPPDPDVPLSTCRPEKITLPDGLYTADATANNARIIADRLAPDFGPPPPGMRTSAALFSAASFDVRAVYDRTADGYGTSEIHQGLVILVPTN